MKQPLTNKNFLQISARDIGIISAKFLLDVGKPLKQSPYIVETSGPKEYAPLAVRDILTTLMGREVKMIGIERDELGSFFEETIPKNLVQPLVELIVASLPGGVTALEIAKRGHDHVYGTETLEAAISSMYQEFLTASKT